MIPLVIVLQIAHNIHPILPVGVTFGGIFSEFNVWSNFCLTFLSYAISCYTDRVITRSRCIFLRIDIVDGLVGCILSTASGHMRTILANGRRRYTCNGFSHWLNWSESIDKWSLSWFDWGSRSYDPIAVVKVRTSIHPIYCLDTDLYEV